MASITVGGDCLRRYGEAMLLIKEFGAVLHESRAQQD